MPSWVRFNDTSDRWEFSVNAGGAWNELPLGIRLINGTAAAPSLAFADDPDTGLYRVAANRYGLVAGGKLLLSGIKNADNAGHTFYSADGTAYLTFLILDNNYSYLSHSSSNAASDLYIRNLTATGALRFGTAGVDKIILTSTGQLYPYNNDSQSLGLISKRWSAVYAGDTAIPINENPGCSIYRSSALSIPNASWTEILWNAEWWDTDAFHSLSSNTGRITIPSGLNGKYLINVRISMVTGGGAGRYILRVLKNGVDWGRCELEAGTNLTYLLLQWNHPAFIECTAAMYFQVHIYQASGPARNTQVGVNCSFTMTRMGDWG